ncbi:thiolase family protein [Desulfatiglans anilini]|uniref:thiolase family protein n=1 Tax=Desulfatiglans anilini TaxID=90728 RepID=UPI00042233F9|nr:thiolase family protein [Desulfatiglans anilini]
MREVAVIGIGQSAFGKFPLRTAADLGAEAVRAALDDCGISPRAIEVAYCARAYDANCTAQGVLKEVGVRGVEMINVENACAGGATSFRGVWKEIADGRYDVGIAIGVECMTTSPIAGKLIPPEKSDLEGHLGLTMPAMFAMVARRQMEQGATVQDFAQVSVKNHHNGCLNPQAQYKKEFSIEDVLNSRMICDPVTLLMCCPNTDGAAAAILCSMEVARRYTTHPIRVMASALCSAEYKYMQEDICASPVGIKVAKAAYEMAGVDPKDIDLVEMHDAFANEEILRYEDLMLCAPGEGVELLRSGATAIGGRIPVNPSGGLLSLGHPLSASGVRTVCEVVLHLRGQAGARQTPNAKVGLAQMLGGLVTNLEHGAVAGIHILGR